MMTPLAMETAKQSIAKAIANNTISKNPIFLATT